MSGIVNDMLVNKLFPKKQLVYEDLYPTNALYPNNDIFPKEQTDKSLCPASTLYPSADIYPADKIESNIILKKATLRFWFKKNPII